MHDASLVNRRSQGSRQTDLGDEERPRNSYPLISAVAAKGQVRSEESKSKQCDRTHGGDQPMGEASVEERQETSRRGEVDLAEPHPQEMASNFRGADDEYLLIHGLSPVVFVAESQDPWHHDQCRDLDRCCVEGALHEPAVRRCFSSGLPHRARRPLEREIEST